MLTTIAVAGYRSLRDLVVPLHGLDVVTGANGSGKSSLYRALRLLADCGSGRVVGSLAHEGGLPSALWAGPETLGGARREGHPVQGTVRRGLVSLRVARALRRHPALPAPRRGPAPRGRPPSASRRTTRASGDVDEPQDDLPPARALELVKDLGETRSPRSDTGPRQPPEREGDNTVAGRSIHPAAK